MKNQEARAKLVTSALDITKGTSIAPSPYELYLLDKYVRGVLDIEEVMVLLEEHELAANKEASPVPAGK